MARDPEEAIREVMSVIFKRPPETVDDMTMDTEPTWDSLAHVELLLTIENELGIRFAEDELPELRSASALLASARRHLAP